MIHPFCPAEPPKWASVGRWEVFFGDSAVAKISGPLWEMAAENSLSSRLLRSLWRMLYSSEMHPGLAPPDDRALVQIVDLALAGAARKSGKWLACRPGCTQCCIGVFAINQLDVVRLRQGLANLDKAAPERAQRIRRRAEESRSRLSRDFPGDPISGLLDEGQDAERRFAEFANDEPCPALDPDTGLCDLYEARPMTCRVFGPPIRSEDGLGVCELCFQGATEKEIAACEMIPDPEDLEAALLHQVETATGARGQTIVAFCLTLPS